MITGGVNAAGKIRGLRCGWSESYLPCRVDVFPDNVTAALMRSTSTNVQYSARVRCRNAADSAWVDLSSASYFQITRNSSGNLDTADVTIQDPATWSAYRTGGTYADVLKPSQRRVQIWAGVTIAGTLYEMPIFQGHITSYTENQGGRGGSINLRLEDLRDLMARTDVPDLLITSATQFRVQLALAQVFSSEQILSTQGSSTFSAADIEAAGNILEAVQRLCPSAPVMALRGAGEIDVGDSASESYGDGETWTYTDSAIVSISRRADPASFNTCRVYGLVSGTATLGETSDAADVALRGKIYAAGIVGSATTQYATNEAVAQTFIGQSLRGTFDAELFFNPFLLPGQWVRVTSSKASIPASRGIVEACRHQFAANRARTYVSGLRLAVI